MRYFLLSAVLTCVLSPVFVRADDKRAKTTDGKEVILRSDGTWSYAGEYTKDKAATLAYKGKRGTFAMHLVADTWKKADKVDNPAVEAVFIHKDGEIMAIIVAERIEVSQNALKKAVLDNMRAKDENARIVFEEKRTVNGKELLCLTVEATIDGVPATFHMYLYSGPEGSIQLITGTARKLFKELKPEMEVF